MCDIDIEQFVKENRKKIEEILKAGDGKGSGPKSEEALKGLFTMLTNPEIQRHFVKAGIEVLSGIEAILRNAPMPDKMRETVDKAYEAKDTFFKEVVCESAGCKKTVKDKKVRKIEVD